MTNKAIEYLVDENYVYAKVLDYFGVRFYDNREKTLGEVCKENDLQESQLISFLDGIDKKKPSTEDLKKYPARLIVEYLKHSHQLFIKDRLPYILKLINAIEDQGDAHLISDLKFILPLFVEDFIKHIYEEEDRFFHYVVTLEKVLNSNNASASFGLNSGDFSIQEFALHHGNSDDEMKGIRGITQDYQISEIEDVHLKVILQELQQFDQELTHHASIENQILFPKAMQLEKRLHNLQKSQSPLN
ncbi:MAG: iron-sulfur cluster repair di-iron protein [Cyclobacteriaceae bacterium]